MSKQPFLAWKAVLIMRNESLPGHPTLIASLNLEQEGSVWPAVGLTFSNVILKS